MNLKIYIDGSFYDQAEAKISVFDHGLLYGDGVFEGIRFYQGRVFRLQEHMERLYDSALAITLQVPISTGETIAGTTPQGQSLRVERDTMGEVAVPASALWGAQTQRAVENFPISGIRIDPAVIRALAAVKAAAARVNARLGVLAPDVADAVAGAAQEVADGAHVHQFPVDVFQTGSGTSTNMNVNEVVAALASQRLGRRVHPNDEVNLGQSSNDVIPTALHVAALLAIENELLPALRTLHAVLGAKAEAFGT